MKPSVYLASHYSRKDEIKRAARDLEYVGVKVSSTWHREYLASDTSLSDPKVSKAYWRSAAKRDFKELESATHLVFLSLSPDVEFTRGAHCVEYGIALALRKHIIVVGPSQHIFCYLPGVKFFDSWKEAFPWLRENL